MNKSVAFGLVVTAALLTGAPARANLVVDGSFEGVSLAAGTKAYFTQTTVPGWTGGARLTFVDTPGSADNGTYLSVYGPFPTTSPDGGNFVEADGSSSYNGAFSQTINGLTVGQRYTLTFDQAAGQQQGYTGATTERWSTTFGGDTQLSGLMSIPQGGVHPWEVVTESFTAHTVSQVLSFLAIGTPNGEPPISFIDGIDIEAVPEPATLSVIGFGLLGLATLRRKLTTRA